MKIKTKIIVIGLLVLGICGIVIQQSYAYYATTHDFSVSDYSEGMNCSVYIDDNLYSGERSMFGYKTVKFIISYDYYSDDGVPYDYTLTIENVDNSTDLLFGYNHVFNDHLTFTGTVDDANSSQAEYIVQIKSNNSSVYNSWVDYKYTLDCKQAY